jgi:hypothetical protein
LVGQTSQIAQTCRSRSDCEPLCDCVVGQAVDDVQLDRPALVVGKLIEGVDERVTEGESFLDARVAVLGRRDRAGARASPARRSRSDLAEPTHARRCGRCRAATEAPSRLARRESAAGSARPGRTSRPSDRSLPTRDDGRTKRAPLVRACGRARQRLPRHAHVEAGCRRVRFGCLPYLSMEEPGTCVSQGYARA